MKTKSSIGIIEGTVINAILCETGDYVVLGPCLAIHWKNQDKVRELVHGGYRAAIDSNDGTLTSLHTPYVTFFKLDDYMTYFEKLFCEDFYIMDNGTWYYIGAGLRTAVPLNTKIQRILKTSECN